MWGLPNHSPIPARHGHLVPLCVNSEIAPPWYISLATTCRLPNTLQPGFNSVSCEDLEQGTEDVWFGQTCGVHLDPLTIELCAYGFSSI